MSNFRSLDNFEDEDLSGYVGDTNDFEFDNTSSAEGDVSLLTQSNSVGIIHPDWSFKYDTLYRFWMRDLGSNGCGLYIGDHTENGWSSLNGFIFGASYSNESTDLISINNGSANFESWANTSYNDWDLFEAIVEQQGDLRIRVLDPADESVQAEATEPVSSLHDITSDPNAVGLAHWDVADAQFDDIQVDSDLIPVTGVVTLDSDPLEGVTVWGINDDNQEVEDVTTTDSNGEYTLEILEGSLAHVKIAYDDGDTQYNAESKPFVAVE